MRLVEYTDYTLRVPMYCAARPPQRVTISELAERHGVSRNHLMKIVTDLGRQGVLETTRGRGGGLAREEAELLPLARRLSSDAEPFDAPGVH